MPLSLRTASLTSNTTQSIPAAPRGSTQAADAQREWVTDTFVTRSDENVGQGNFSVYTDWKVKIVSFQMMSDTFESENC